MAQSLADYIARDRERLQAEREVIFTQQHELETKLAAVNREFAAIEAYEAAKKAPAARGRKAATGTRKRSKRDGILAALAGSPGMTRGELIEKLGMKGDKSHEMSVSNALTALIKGAQVVRGADKKYHPTA
jgi:hypothetical protein